MRGFLKLFGYACCFTMPITANAAPLDVLGAQYPALYQLYNTNKNYQDSLTRYAARQGFRRPIENLATVVHEMIHVDSFVHQGFFIDGVYYEPYLKREAWPTVTNKEIAPQIPDREKGTVFQLYVRHTPTNHLGNVVDEINAYGHVLPFVCRNEQESTEKQVKNLVGFLNLSEGYLRTLRTGVPAEYRRFHGQPEARGVFVHVIQRAWNALKECGVPVATIPVQEATLFVSL